MASKRTTSIALFLVLNFVFFTLSSACNSCPTPKPKPPPKPKACPPPPKHKTPTPSKPTPTPSKPTPTPSPTMPTPTPSKPTPTPSPTMPTPTPSKPTPTPSPSKPTCPRDILKLGVCADLLSGLIGVTIGSPANTPCCTLIQGLADLDAAVCLCTAIKANVLGINLNVPVSLSVLLNVCERKVPEGFKCE